MPDLQIALALYVIQTGTLAVLLLGAWLGARREVRLAVLGLGLVFASLGLSMIGGWTPLPSGLTDAIGYPLSLFAFVPCTVALADSRRAHMPAAALLPALIWFAASLILPLQDSFAHRLTVYLLALSVGHLVLAVAALQITRGRSRQRVSLSASWIIQSCLALSLALTVVIVAPDKAVDIPTPSVAVILFQIGMIISLVLMAWIHLDHSQQNHALQGRMDRLTGTLNRQSFIAAFKASTGSKKPAIALIVFKVDGFRGINAALGPGGGDALLVEFAYLCGAHLPEQAVLGRTGSAEFSVALGVEGARQAVLLAETIRLALESRSSQSGTAQKATVSVGIATAEPATAQFEPLMLAASEALATAIARGGNRTSVKTGEKLVTIPAEAPRGIDAQADRQVAILRRIAATGAALD